MAENLNLLPDEKIILIFKGFNLTNKRIIRFSKNTFESLLLEQIDSFHYVKKDYKILIFLSVLSILLGVVLTYSNSYRPHYELMTMGFVAAIVLIVAYFVTLKEALLINSFNSYIAIKAHGNNMSEMYKFVNETITQKELLKK